MQVYRGMDIGSAKITPQEMQGIPHYLVDVLDPKEDFNVATFCQMAKEAIDDIYDKAIANGASGGKLLGAGGNGFMLFYVDEDCQKAVRKALSDYRELNFTFDDEGSKVVYNDEM